MSPVDGASVGPLHSFPRVSGDEPAAMDANPIGLMFSPRERG